jgi:hypothetical protein
MDKRSLANENDSHFHGRMRLKQGVFSHKKAQKSQKPFFLSFVPLYG